MKNPQITIVLIVLFALSTKSYSSEDMVIDFKADFIEEETSAELKEDSEEGEMLINRNVAFDEADDKLLNQNVDYEADRKAVMRKAAARKADYKVVGHKVNHRLNDKIRRINTLHRRINDALKNKTSPIVINHYKIAAGKIISSLEWPAPTEEDPYTEDINFDREFYEDLYEIRMMQKGKERNLIKFDKLYDLYFEFIVKDK